MPEPTFEDRLNTLGGYSRWTGPLFPKQLAAAIEAVAEVGDAYEMRERAREELARRENELHDSATLALHEVRAEMELLRRILDLKEAE